MTEPPKTWHYGLIARYWGEFNDDFRMHEVPYFQKFIESDGQPALDVACGTGRLLLPYLRAGLDVEGCDVSADMIAVCRAKARSEGLSPNLYVQPMHALDLPHRYRTIFVCGAFGPGSDRERDGAALRGFHDWLEPGGTLLLDMEVPYADGKQWSYWLKDERASLPEAAQPPGRRRARPMVRSTRCGLAASSSTRSTSASRSRCALSSGGAALSKPRRSIGSTSGFTSRTKS